MKTRFLMFAMMMCVAAIAFTACSDDDDRDQGIKVPESVVKALQQRYPEALQVEWERKAEYYVADCRLNGRDANVWFDAYAIWCMTEVDMTWDGLPSAVQTTFMASEYAEWEKDDCYMLIYSLAPLQYAIEVEQGKTSIQLFYSEDGEPINELDVTGKDDTIYPPAS